MYNVLKYRKTWWNNDKNTIYRNRNAAATKPDFRQFNEDQYCTMLGWVSEWERVNQAWFRFTMSRHYIWIILQYWSLLNWKKIAVLVRFRCGCGKLTFWLYFIIFLRYLRSLYIVWSLVRRRDTRRLTRLQAMCNVLKYCKIFKNAVAVIFFN